MNKGITVLELAKLCVAELEKGNGNKHVCISNDDEGNGFHTLFYGFTSNKGDIKFIVDSCYLHDNNNIDEIVLLG